ncbi:MAG: hypothetical protein AAGH82_06960, partial [Pseudomonadota bacterium]
MKHHHNLLRRSGAVAIMAAALLSFTGASASALSKAQEEQAFLTADANGSKTLDKREFRSFINRLADLGLPVAKRVRRFGVYGIAFRRS